VLLIQLHNLYDPIKSSPNLIYILLSSTATVQSHKHNRPQIILVLTKNISSGEEPVPWINITGFNGTNTLVANILL